MGIKAFVAVDVVATEMTQSQISCCHHSHKDSTTWSGPGGRSHTRPIYPREKWAVIKRVCSCASPSGSLMPNWETGLKAIQNTSEKSRGSWCCRYPSPDRTSHTPHHQQWGGCFFGDKPFFFWELWLRQSRRMPSNPAFHPKKTVLID